jgi:hypothetical protein
MSNNCFPSLIVRWILNFVDQPTQENYENWYPTNKSDFTVLDNVNMFLAHLAKGNVSFLPSLGVCRLLTFHILIFSSETLNKSANQKQKLSVVAMFVNGSGRNEQSL